MSDDGFNFEDTVRDSIEVHDLLDKPDINDYLYDYEPEWEAVWEAAPVEDMSPGMIDAMIDMIMDNWQDMDWDDIYGGWDDFWEWFRENY